MGLGVRVGARVAVGLGVRVGARVAVGAGVLSQLNHCERKPSATALSSGVGSASGACACAAFPHEANSVKPPTIAASENARMFMTVDFAMSPPKRCPLLRLFGHGLDADESGYSL